MKISTIIFFICLNFCLNLLCLQAQNLPPIYPYLQAEVLDTAAKPIKNAFAGGFNSPQISPIDLNNDGIKDLFVFDKKSQKYSTFINGGTYNEVDYYYAPEYQALFPELKDWVLLVDFNGDGLEDIFTHIAAYVIAYKSYFKNGRIQFEIADTLFFKNRNGFTLNVFVSTVDLPAITDVNGDGDIDVLTFDQQGLNVEYYENLQVENSLPKDSLFFEKASDCWGQFSENSTDAGINLNLSCKGGGSTFVQNDNENAKHVGSTITAFDYDGDKDKDVLIGDVGSKSLALLINGGDTSHAKITEAITQFPAGDNPFDNFFFPSSFILDVDNDCRLDVVASHNTSSDAEDHNHIWFYKNKGDENEIQLNFRQKNFLLDNIIDVGTVAVPAIADINNDGKDDLLIGNKFYFDKRDTSKRAQLAAYLNISTENEIIFQHISDDFAELSQYNMIGIYPAFGDIDLDGDIDMICTDYDGFFHYFKNEAAEGEWMNLQASQLYIDSLKLDKSPFPFLYDYDEDGLLDIITGTRGGTLNYVKNTGTENEIHLAAGKMLLGMINESSLGRLGYSAPYISTLDESDKKYLLVHSGAGNIAIFDSLKADIFPKIKNTYASIKTGGGGGITVSDFNKDGLYEIVVGTQTGGVQLFSQKQTKLDFIVYNSNYCLFDTLNSIESQQGYIQIYPTIAQNQLFIKTNLALNASYKIFNVKGQVVLASNLHHNSIKVNGLPNGLYFLNTSNNITLRFLKK